MVNQPTCKGCRTWRECTCGRWTPIEIEDDWILFTWAAIAFILVVWELLDWLD